MDNNFIPSYIKGTTHFLAQMVGAFSQPVHAVSKSVHCCLNDRPKPNLPKQKGIHPLGCSVWVC